VSSVELCDSRLVNAVAARIVAGLRWALSSQTGIYAGGGDVLGASRTLSEPLTKAFASTSLSLASAMVQKSIASCGTIINRDHKPALCCRRRTLSSRRWQSIERPLRLDATNVKVFPECPGV
jgi:hypothetical protein